MKEYRADCIINLHVEEMKKDGSATRAWSCSITHEKHGRLVLAQKSMGSVDREAAELAALLFGLQQASRFLQEKVELRATFRVQDRLPKTDKMPPAPGAEADPAKASWRLAKWNVAKAWLGFRLRRVERMDHAEEKILRDALALVNK